MNPNEKFITQMLNPSADLPDKEWCYLAKSTVVIGVPFQPDVTQVTYDGALFTKHAELSFFYGKDKTPVMARQKTFAEGWIPVVQYDWTEDDLRYDLEMFAAQLDGEDESNTVNFASITITNKGELPKTAYAAAAMRNTGKDYRFQGLDFSNPEAPLIPMEFDENWLYEMQDDSVLRGGKLVYTFDSCAEKEMLNDIPYTTAFTGKDQGIEETTHTCFSCFKKELAPGERVRYTFKMPRVPVSVTENGDSETAFVSKLKAADYDSYRQKTITYWKNIIEQGSVYSIPEKRIQNAMYASFVNVLLSTRTRDGVKIQTDGLPYPNFFLTSLPQMGFSYLSMGHPEYLPQFILQAVEQQEENGLYFDRSLAHGEILPAAHGHIMYITATYCMMCEDFDTAKTVYPSIKKAVSFIKDSMEQDEYGLLPPTYPYDNEMIDGHYTSNNMWALLGLRCAIRLAEMLDEKQDAADWSSLEKDYSANIQKAIEASAHADGYVPTGLYKFLTGPTARRGFKEFQCNSDWENMLLSYPTEVLSTNDPKLKGTLDRVRKNYAEGIMTYRHGMHLHQYITANLIEQYMVMGDSYTALKDYYHLLLHSGSCHEGFENLVKPWADRQVGPDCPAPHGWASAKIVFLTRNLLIHEFGGKAGLIPTERSLQLFSVLSPEWTKPGQTISFKNVLTEMGTISASMNCEEDAAEIHIESKFTHKPGCYRIRIPYFKEVSGVETDAALSKIENGWIILSSDATEIKIFWSEKADAHMNTFENILTEYRSCNSFNGIDEDYCPIIKEGVPFLLDNEKKSEPQPLSFKMVQETFKYEYDRRARLFEADGNPLISPDMR